MAAIFPRIIENSIKEKFNLGKVIILYGARQVGKTTLVKKIISESASKSIYFQCDDFETKNLIENKGLSSLARLVKDYDLVVFDEAQKIENIGTTLKLLVDNFPKKQFLATGSSSFELANKVNESLTGRKFVFTLYPLSVLEMNSVLNPVELTNQIKFSLQYGLYPDIVTSQTLQIESKLNHLSTSYLYKDILDLEDIRSPEVLPNLLKLLAYQIGNQVSYNELATKLGINKDTVIRYINLIEKSFIIFRLPAYSKNQRKEVTKSRKIYFTDIGIRNSLIKAYDDLDFRPDIGALWENFCVVERIKTLEYKAKSVNSYFWRNYKQKEVDYIEESNNKLDAWEFKWGKAKKFKKPKDFIDNYNPETFEVINQDNWTEFLL